MVCCDIIQSVCNTGGPLRLKNALMNVLEERRKKNSGYN